MPFIPAIVAGVGSIVGGAAAGVAGLAAGAASAVGTVASGILGGAAGLAGGSVSAVGGIASGLLGGGGQAAVPVMLGGEMGSLAAASTLGVPAATAGVSTGLSTLASYVGAGVGLYGQLADIEMAKGMTEAEKIKAQTSLMEAEALKIYAAGGAPAAPAPAPTLSSQPIYVTPAVTPAAPNYLLYAGLAILVIFLFRKK